MLYIDLHSSQGVRVASEIVLTNEQKNELTWLSSTGRTSVVGVLATHLARLSDPCQIAARYVGRAGHKLTNLRQHRQPRVMPLDHHSGMSDPLPSDSRLAGIAGIRRGPNVGGQGWSLTRSASCRKFLSILRFGTVSCSIRSALLPRCKTQCDRPAPLH